MRAHNRFIITHLAKECKFPRSAPSAPVFLPAAQGEKRKAGGTESTVSPLLFQALIRSFTTSPARIRPTAPGTNETLPGTGRAPSDGAVFGFNAGSLE